MAVHSNTFGGAQLSGADATKFRSQTRAGHASAAAKRSAANGIQAARKLLDDGQVKIAERPA